jgi:hypothetical protein
MRGTSHFDRLGLELQERIDVGLSEVRKFVSPLAGEDWMAIATRALPQTDPDEAVGQLQSWNFHVFMRPVGAAGHSILPSDIIFVEAPKPA